MEQIQIRQPKMPAAQSFIQILETFLAVFLNFIAAHFSQTKNNLFNLKTAKALAITRLIPKKSNFIFQRKDITEK